MEYMIALLKEMALVPVTLLPIINPLSIASIFVSSVGNKHGLARLLARQIGMNVAWVIIASMLVGTYVLTVFGISLAVVRFGGGLLVAASAWRMLAPRPDTSPTAHETEAAGIADDQLMQRSFYPLTFPLTTGPGVISACITLGAHGESMNPLHPLHFLSGAIVAVGGALMVAVVIYLILRNSIVVVTRLGPSGAVVMQQLVAFVLLCIGIQLVWSGWLDLSGT